MKEKDKKKTEKIKKSKAIWRERLQTRWYRSSVCESLSSPCSSYPFLSFHATDGTKVEVETRSWAN